MTTTQALERARALSPICKNCGGVGWVDPPADDNIGPLTCGVCGVCLGSTKDPASERKIAAALKRAWADGLQSGTRYMSAYWANQAIEIASKMRAEADALDRNNK